MSSYYVQVNADFYKGYSVEADSEEEALEIAKENLNTIILVDGIVLI